MGHLSLSFSLVLLLFGSEAEDLYRRAAARASEGDAKEALALLRASFAAGLPDPSRALTDPALRTLRSRTTRPSLRALSKEFARESSLVLAPADEPGDPLVVSGTVRDAEGRPVGGALVHVFQTDARGLYSEDGMDESNPRLFSYLRTGADGRYRFRTIRPAHYPDETEPVEQHIHYEVTAKGFETRRHRLGFRDDPFWEREGKTPPAWAAPVERDGDGVPSCVADVVLSAR